MSDAEKVRELERKLAAAQLALFPFARLADSFASLPDTAELTIEHTPGFTGLCVGDLRKAKLIT